MKLSSEQKQYIKDHPTESAYAMAKRFGCAEQSVYYYLHKYHGDSFLERKKEEKEYKKKVIMEMYPTTSATEIGKILGITRSAVNNMAMRLGVVHTEETKEILKKKFIEAGRRPEVVARRVENARRTIMLDRIRASSGLPQRTKWKFKSIPTRILQARNYICKAYNYFYDKELGELYTLFYDSKTKRLPPEKEQHYKDAYHLEFRQADE